MDPKKKPDEVRGTSEFSNFYKSLNKESEIGKKVQGIINALRTNMLVGNKIGREKWPKIYVTKHDIKNLFVAEGDRGSRLTYTILSSGEKIEVVVLEFFPDHKSYEKRFGYS